MRVLVRADASTQTGIGHVMRCLTLAESLGARGVSVTFSCREHPGNLIDLIRRKGFVVHVLPAGNSPIPLHPNPADVPRHAAWLGVPWRQDVADVMQCMVNEHFDWLVVDHYALDVRWETALRTLARKIMVIDDLADRRHDADILIDQTYGIDNKSYQPLVSDKCKLLLGTQYAMLRPEFSELRARSLQRRALLKFPGRLLVSLGGTDPDNVTAKILTALIEMQWPYHVDVVLGPTSTNMDAVGQLCKELEEGHLYIGVNNMAELMLEADLAIGAAGSSSWERCVMGLPTLMSINADNQKIIANNLLKEGAATILGNGADIEPHSVRQKLVEIQSSPEMWKTISERASRICDGFGVSRIVEEMLGHG